MQATIERLDRAGFTAIDVWLEGADNPAGSRHAPGVPVDGVRSRARRALAEGLRPPFLDAPAEQAAADSPPFTLDYRRLNIYARKPAGIEQAA